MTYVKSPYETTSNLSSTEDFYYLDLTKKIVAKHEIIYRDQNGKIITKREELQ
jgi:hypothetical protein